MEDRPTAQDPDEAERHFAAMLEEAGLPRFTSAVHDPEIDELQVTWDHGLTIHIDLSRGDWEPFDESDRAAILGELYFCPDHEPIRVTVAGSADDPRAATSIPGVVIHRVPALHPDDVTLLNGIPGTSPSRTSTGPPWTMKRPPKGASVASMRSRYWTMSGPTRTERRWAMAYAFMDATLRPQRP